MNEAVNQGKKSFLVISSPFALIVWIIFLSVIIIPIAVVVNFNMAYGQFKIEMAEHWIGYKPPAPTNGTTSLSVSALEKTYNKMAHAMNHICARITGGTVINGEPQQIHGSGVIIADQYVLTNYHVVTAANDLLVTVYTSANKEESFPATILMSDPGNDLALMKLESNTPLPSASLGNSDNINPGDIVYAMGNAFGAGNVFTTGVVCDRRQTFSVAGRTYNNMIRTESYTYPGSSGGPLTNINGEVIGINTAVYNPQGKFTGISFSMPINRALALLEKSGIPAFCNTGVPGVGGQAVGVAYANNPYSLTA